MTVRSVKRNRGENPDRDRRWNSPLANKGSDYRINRNLQFPAHHALHNLGALELGKSAEHGQRQLDRQGIVVGFVHDFGNPLWVNCGVAPRKRQII